LLGAATASPNSEFDTFRKIMLENFGAYEDGKLQEPNFIGDEFTE
jgi:hypothetical protein